MSNTRKKVTKQSEFNKFFAKLRERKDLNGNVENVPYQEIADATGISVPYLSGMDKKEDRVPSDKFLVKLSKFFNRDIDDFYLALGRLPDEELKESLKLRKSITKEEYVQFMKEYDVCRENKERRLKDKGRIEENIYCEVAV